MQWPQSLPTAAAQSGGVRNVTFENIVMGPRHVPFTEGPLIHLKSQRGRGGYIRDIHFRNITMLGETNQAILVSMHYSNKIGPTNKTATPQFSDIFFDGVEIEAGACSLLHPLLPLPLPPRRSLPCLVCDPISPLLPRPPLPCPSCLPFYLPPPAPPRYGRPDPGVAHSSCLFFSCSSRRRPY